MSRLLRVIRQDGAEGESPAFLAKLRSLVNGRWLRTSVELGGKPLATLEALTRAFQIEEHPPLERCMLSRFAFLRRFDNDLALETPLSAARVRLHGPQALEALSQLSRPSTVDELKAALPADEEAVTGLLSLLQSAGLLTETDAEGNAHEDDEPGLQFWEFHDLLFHSRSREGRNDLPVGATFFWAGSSDPPPAVVTDEALPAISLDAPESFPPEDRSSLANLSERRRSEREYGRTPLSARDLGHFLYRVGRVTERSSAELETWNGPVQMEFAARPYPAGGALYEIELYPLVVRCAGLESGLYHYDAVRHALVNVDADESLTSWLTGDAAYAVGMSPDDVQVLVILAARFPRLMWKYSSMAYAAILKHVGVLYQSMYLTATDLQLAPCAVGIGNSDIFARALKSDYYAETSVGEFLLGSRAVADASDGA